MTKPSNAKTVSITITMTDIAQHLPATRSHVTNPCHAKSPHRERFEKETINMTYREKKSFLASYIRAENALRASLEEYERWETIGTKVNQVLSATPGAGGDSCGKVERAAMEMASIMEGIEADISSAKRTKQEILDAINTIPQLRYRDILKYRYICRLSNEKIAEMIGKDVKTLEKVMRSAIHQFNP